MPSPSIGRTNNNNNKVTISHPATSSLARQIEQGADVDVFAPVDQKWMNCLADQGLIDPNSRVDLLTNHLVLIAPKNSGPEFDIKGESADLGVSR